MRARSQQRRVKRGGRRGESTKSGIGNARLSVHGLQRAMSVAFLAGLSSA